RVMVETASQQKHRWGMMAYVATTLRILPEVRNIPFVVEVDGNRHEVEAALLMIANCGELIPRMIKMGSGISPHDGVLDLIAVRADSFGSSVRAVWDLFTERTGTYGKDAMVGYARGRHFSVTIAGGERHPVQLDGDPGGETPFEVEVVPGAIQVLMPPE
ncbi:MAG TPA: hypothetical protein PLL69_03480, partial [Gemmatimonadales bacterium]|nr:hypothetical protein [Gemmatimonadales bacterium]